MKRIRMEGRCKFCGDVVVFHAKSYAEAKRMEDAVWVCEHPACEDAWHRECELSARLAR